MIQSSFKLRGFQLRLEACKFLEELLSALESSEWSEWIDKMIEVLVSKDLESAVIDKELMNRIVQVTVFSR